MLKWASLVLAALVGCAPDDTAQTIAEAPMPPGARAPAPLTMRVQGEGTEMHAVLVDATIGEVHEALVHAAARRLTGAEAEGAGLEILVVDEQHADALIRAVRSTAAPTLTWMGLPVRWHVATAGSGCSLRVRSWPIITELGPRSVVEYQLIDADDQVVCDELLLVPSEAVALAAGGVGWPLEPDASTPLPSAAAAAMRWDASAEAPPVGLILLVPRFDAGQ